MSYIRIIGAGLAGTEAAYWLANKGFQIELIEMKPQKFTPAQHLPYMCELVCSNSFRSNNPRNAVGLLKEEMRLAGSLTMQCAPLHQVPAGDALAVEREGFAKEVEQRIRSHTNIRVINKEMEDLPEDDVPTIIATGPLTSPALSTFLAKLVQTDNLAFYDAIAPIIDAESIDMDHAFFASRWQKGNGDDYLNCPLSKEEYLAFYETMIKADQAEEKSFEKLKFFEGCLPVEEMAQRGVDTLRYGPFKPVGLWDERKTERPYAVLQLRKENIYGTAYNLVGCQTRLKQPAQKEVFGLIPALKNARFLRYGSLHRNTYLNSPQLLNPDFSLKTTLQPIFFAGQITGVEGYVESAACGMLVAWQVWARLTQQAIPVPPNTCAFGGLYNHCLGLIQTGGQRYSPSNINWSLIAPLEKKIKDKNEKGSTLALRAITDFTNFLHNMNPC